MSTPCHPCSFAARRRGQAGAALVVALLVFALCAALVVGLEKEFTLYYQRGANQFLAEQSQAYLRGAEDLAGLALQADYDTDQQREQPRDDLTEIWAQQASPYPLDEGGWLMGGLSDLQGRFNLNSLLPAQRAEGEEGPRFTPAQELFIRLLQALDGVAVDLLQAQQITESVGDWIDPDNVPLPLGAEDDYYFSLSPAYRAPNQSMASVSELRAVANMTPEIYLALEPLVTVWPRAPGTINIHTAPLAVLRSINSDGVLEPLSPADGQSLADYRRDIGFVDLDDLFAQPVFDDSPRDGVRGLLGESSSWFLLSATAEVAERRSHLYSVLQRSGRSVSAVSRVAGSL